MINKISSAILLLTLLTYPATQAQSVNLKQITSLVSSSNTYQTQSTEQPLKGQYFLYSRGKETLGLGGTRISFLEESGVLHLSYGSTTFTWHIDDDNVYVLSLDKPVLQSNSFDSVSTPSGFQQVQRQYLLTGMKLSEISFDDGSKGFITEFETTTTYPNGELPDETRLFKTEHLYSQESDITNVAELLPLNQVFSLPLSNSQNKSLEFSNGLRFSATVTDNSMRVNIIQKSPSSATGSWEYYGYDDTGKEQIISETVNISFLADNSALFVGENGLTAKAIAFKRSTDEQILLSVLYFKANEDFQSQKLAATSMLNIKNPTYNRKATGKYLLRQNNFEKEYNWLEVNEDGSALVILASDRNNDGFYSSTEVTTTPYLWQYTDQTETAIDYRNYRYKAGSGKSGNCIPDTFAPKPNSNCVTYSHRTIIFFDNARLNDQDIVTSVSINRLYRTSFYQQEFDIDAPQGMSVDNRYVYLIDKRPVELPEPPINDNFANAISLNTSSGKITGSTLHATRESSERCHDNNCSTQSVWYSFSTSKAGELTIELSGDNASYPNVTVYSVNETGYLNPLGLSQPSEQSMLWKNDVAANTNLYIAVHQVEAAPPIFSLSWAFVQETETLISALTFKDNTLKNCAINTGLTFAEEVTKLTCQGVTDLTGIEYFKNLSDITLNGQHIYQAGKLEHLVITDLSPLAALKKVRSLRLENNNLSDKALEALSEFRLLPSNVELVLNANLLTDKALLTISKILTNATSISLNIEKNNFTTLSGLSELTNVNSLNIGANPINDLPQVMLVINQFENLWNLILRELNITTLKNLSIPQQIYHLDLSANPLNNLQEVLAKINVSVLGSLNLSYTDISDFSYLANSKLSTLTLYNTKLTDLAFVKTMPNLTHLGIANTYVKSLKDIYGLTNLRSVILSGLSQIPCSQFTELKNNLPNLFFYSPDICVIDNNYAYRLEQYSGKIVNSVEFYPWSEVDYSQYGSIEWVNGVLTFKPKAGLTGLIELIFLVKTGNTNWQVTLYVNIEPKQKKRRGLPLWMLTLPENQATN